MGNSMQLGSILGNWVIGNSAMPNPGNQCERVGIDAAVSRLQAARAASALSHWNLAEVMRNLESGREALAQALIGLADASALEVLADSSGDDAVDTGGLLVQE